MSDTMWNPAILSALGSADEVDIAPAREDGSLRPGVTIWSIRVGDDLYIRSWKGAGAGWFRHLTATGGGTISVTGGGAQQSVFAREEHDASINAAIDAEYLRKYSTTSYASAMNEPTAAETTLKLIPR
jgi:hypothetical protein